MDKKIRTRKEKEKVGKQLSSNKGRGAADGGCSGKGIGKPPTWRNPFWERNKDFPKTGGTGSP